SGLPGRTAVAGRRDQQRCDRGQSEYDATGRCGRGLDARRGARRAHRPGAIGGDMRRKQPNFPGTAFEDESESVCVAVTTRAEAELIVGMLRSGGLRAATSAHDAGGWQPELQLQGVQVLVPRADE